MTTEKRSIDKQLQFNVSVIIVDIEGTTTSINFVKETLFPYAREHLEEYIKSNWSEKELQEDVALLREQASKDVTDKVEGAVSILDGDDDEAKSSLIKNVIWQMDNDRKTKALKQLQGHIWRSGYTSGKLVGHIYDDVKECLKSWTEAGKKIFVYSSGSVEAQKLLFGNTKDGDLLPMFSGHFDTEVGAKTESASYTKILDKLRESSNLGQDTKDVLFLTDVLKEAQAAAEAGIQAVIVSREGNAPLPDDIGEKFSIVDSFSDLIFEGNAKRRKLSDVTEKIDNNDESKNGIISEGGSNDAKDVEMEVCTNSNSTPATESADGKKEENTKSVESDSKGDGVSSTENSKSEIIETNGDLKNDTTEEKKEETQSEDDKQTVVSSSSVTTTTDSKTNENSSNEPTDSIPTSTDADVNMEEPKTDDKDKGSIVKEHPKNEDNKEEKVVKSDADKPINNTTESADEEMNVEEKKEVGEVENKSTVNGIVSESKKDTPTDSNTASNDVEMKLEDSKAAGDDGISNVINENIENEKTVEIKPDLLEKNESKDKEEDKTVVEDVKEPKLETSKVEESTNEVKPDGKKSEEVEELETNNKDESKNEAVSVAEPVTAEDKTDDKRVVVENKTEEKQEVTSSEVVNVDKKVEESQSGELESKEKDVKMEEKNDSEVTSSKTDEEKQVVENSEVKVDNKETKVTEDSSDKKITDVEMPEDNNVDSSKTDSEVLKVDKTEDKNEKTDNDETSKCDKVENKETENKTEATNGIDKVTNGNHEGKNGITEDNCDNSKTADETNNIKEKIAEKIKESNENGVEPVAGEV